MKENPLKVSDYLVQFLADRKITHVFEVIGGMVTHLIDSFNQNGRIQVVSMHHEQAAAFAAEGYARASGLLGVSVATSGPGAVNLLTGIGSCYFDSVPALFITGQVNRNELKGSRGVRQLGFQETDIVPMARPICKAASQIMDPANIPHQMQSAFALAFAGRSGPVLVDIPMDVQRGVVSDNDRDITPASPPVEPANLSANLRDLLSAWQRAKRPLILAGGGLRAARAAVPFRKLVRSGNTPVIHSLMGVDALTYDDPCRVGMIGTYGNRWANLAMGQADFLLVLGSRLDVRQTGSNVVAFKDSREIYHVDIDPSEMNNRITGCTEIVCDLALFFQALHQEMANNPAPQCPSSWVEQIAVLRSQFPDSMELNGTDGINPNMFIHALSRASASASAFVVDVGQHQMWAAQSVELLGEQRFMTSGGMGAMGFALPAAIGAAFAAPGQPVVCVAGDGGFQLNIQELQTVVHHNLPVKMVIINNRSLGMVRQFQQDYFNARYQSTIWGYSAPDFAGVAQAYGIESLTVTDPAEISTAIAKLWRQPAKPFLLQVMLNPMTNVYPKIAFGKPITEMDPTLELHP